MNMDKLNKWLTFLANFGVMLGLFFLVLELNQNASIARAETFQKHQSEMSVWRSMVLTDPELASLYRTYIGESEFSELNQEEMMRLAFIQLNLFSVFENAYYSVNYDVLGDIEWRQLDQQACEHYNRMNRVGMTRNFNFMTDEFVEHLETSC